MENIEMTTGNSIDRHRANALRDTSRDKLSNLRKRLSQSSEIEKQTNYSWHIEL